MSGSEARGEHVASLLSLLSEEGIPGSIEELVQRFAAHADLPVSAAAETVAFALNNELIMNREGRILQENPAERVDSSRQVPPRRHIDQVDQLRVTTVLFTVLEMIQAGEAPTLVDRLRAAYELYEPELLMRTTSSLQTQEDLKQEVQGLFHMVVWNLPETLDQLEVSEGCISWQQAQEGTPEFAWVRFCKSCDTSHMYPGRRWSPDWSYEFVIDVRVAQSGDEQ